MAIEELKEIIARNEGETIEFKESTGQRVDACESLCAFLNRDGGVVVFGVSRKGKLTGQLVADTTKRDLFEAFQKFEPAADVEVEWVPVDETQTIETWGRGLTRIAAECQRVGLPLPTTTTEHGNVLTVFQHPRWTRTGTVAEISGTTNPRTGTMPVITGTRWVVLVSDPVAHLPSLRKDAHANAESVQALLRDRRLSAVRLAEHLGVKPRQAQRIIAKLKIKAGLTRRGTDKNGEWYFDGDVL